MKEKAKPTFVQSRVADGPGEGPSIAAFQFVSKGRLLEQIVRFAISTILIGWATARLLPSHLTTAVSFPLDV